MSYHAGTINDANPGAALYAVLAVDLAAAGFTLVDTVVISTRTHKIWKSPAGSNAAGLDWYLDVHYTTTGAATLRFTVFEYFDPATDLGYRGPYGAASTVIDATTYSRFGATGSALETNWLTNMATVTLAGSTTIGYWFSATPDRVMLMTDNNAQYVLYAGLFEPTAEHASYSGGALFPLIVTMVAPTGQAVAPTGCSLTRIPKRANGSISWNSHVYIDSATMLFLLGGQVGVAASGATNLTKLAPLPILQGSSGGVVATSDFVGVLYDVGIAFVTASAVRGDTITADSDTWVATAVSSSRSLFFRAV